MALYYGPIADGLNLNYLRNVIYKYIYIYLQAFYGVLLPMDKDLYPNQVIIIFSLAICGEDILCYKGCIIYNSCSAYYNAVCY